MVGDAPDLWFSPTSPLGVTAEDAGTFGSVCEALGFGPCLHRIYFFFEKKSMGKVFWEVLL